MKHNILLVEPTIKPNGVAILSENGNVFMAPNGDKVSLGAEGLAGGVR